ncbi:lambda exonuclease family protein [Bartonella tamiae]|uniref:lambda exonuclease family protein n=1 Tax=Bartonella tamiae TaxID=373638 RepID=UPI00026E7A7A|nr:lambda exonuclease family protein [Bartonella tamiae]EJF92679.1 hypothetical protein MEG_01849 [Bartonella tamiae Th307]
MAEIIQRSPEWFELRLGKVTASRIHDVMSKTKSGYSTSRANYMAELVLQNVTHSIEQTYISQAMQWGTDTEEQARNAYSFYSGNEVDEIAFINHPVITQAGASPDGLIAHDGLLEIKCPNSATHLDTLLNSKINRKYLLQMQWQMACTGRKWCDFVSYDPRFPEEMVIFIKRINRDDDLISEITNEVTKFIDEMNETCAKLKTQYMEAA